MEDFRVVEVRAQFGTIDGKRFIEIIQNNNKLIEDGWHLKETREQSIEEHDQRDGSRKRFIGWLFIYVK